MSDRIRHFRGDPSSFAPHGMLSCLCQAALLGEHRAVVATPEPPLSCCCCCCCLQEIPQHRGAPEIPSLQTQGVQGTARGVLVGTQEGSVCTSSQVRAHVHKHKYPPTHTASEQMTQRFLWKDVRSI